MTLKAQVSFTYDVKDLDRIVRELKKAGTEVAEVGIFGAEPHNTAEGLTVASVAAINEFGSEEAGIPERPFIQTTAATTKVRVPVKAAYLSILKGTGTARRLITSAGKFMASDMKNIVEQFSQPPNAPSTIEKKGFDNPLIETRQMQRSITSRVKKR